MDLLPRGTVPSLRVTRLIFHEVHVPQHFLISTGAARFSFDSTISTDNCILRKPFFDFDCRQQSLDLMDVVVDVA